MSKAWPSDRTFVDVNRKIVDAWNGPLQQLKPLLALTTEDFATLQDLIRAAQETEDGGSPLDLPIDTAPLFSADYVVGYDKSETEGRLYPLALFSRAPVFISSATLNGSEVNIAVPAGFTNVQVRIAGLSVSTNASATIAFSEDGGTTLLTQVVHQFNHSDSHAGSTAGAATLSIITLANADTMDCRLTIYDYSSSLSKYIEESGLVPTGTNGWFGTRLVSSTRALNLIQLASSAGTFDAGTIELWGLP